MTAWLAASLLSMLTSGGSTLAPSAQFRVSVSFPNRVHSEPITGRVLLRVSRRNVPEVRLQQGWLPIFGIDVNELKPGCVAVIDEGTPGAPLPSLSDLPPGDYEVQAVLNVYTEFRRADGRVIWAHMDQGEGQDFARSPGNLYSRSQTLHVIAGKGFSMQLELTEVIPPVPVEKDSAWVKHIRIRSDLLSKFWGRPMYIGAVVLLPRGYSEHSHARFPVIYEQGHFIEKVPFNFRTDDPSAAELERHHELGFKTGYRFFRAWQGTHFPRMIAVTFQHPTPFYDDSYAVNSANNGPYGDALMNELIPYIESHFRTIAQPYARILTGGSTGGWESLALQLYHPDFFGGTWTFYPDPVDFHRYSMVDIYTDDNAFEWRSRPGRPAHDALEWLTAKRYYFRWEDGQPLITVEQQSRLESVLGEKGRSAEQLAAFEAAYGPVGEDGYPKPLWDKNTGAIDHNVANYMRDHGYDLDEYVRLHWAEIGAKLVGKLHFYCGDMDNHYLNLSLYLLQQTLQIRKDPAYEGSFEFGRPLKPHGWRPMADADLVRTMATHIQEHLPADSRTDWLYD